MEITNKLKKHIFLKIIAVIIGLWILIMGIDFIRFYFSDKPIKPLLCIDKYACQCFEWRAFGGIGYTFNYYYESEEAFDIKKPDHKRFEFMEFKIYGT